MLTRGGEGDGHIKKGPQIHHECLDGIVILLIEMRNIWEKECGVYVCVCVPVF